MVDIICIHISTQKKQIPYWNGTLFDIRVGKLDVMRKKRIQNTEYRIQEVFLRVRRAFRCVRREPSDCAAKGVHDEHEGHYGVVLYIHKKSGIKI